MNKSNLQADSLISINSNYFLSEPIELSKKHIKELKVGSWLKIEQEYLDIFVIKNSLSAKIFSKDSYLILEKKEKKAKKFKIKKEQFSIKYGFQKELVNRVMAISKLPIRAVLLKGKRDFANINLYINDAIYLEIKELL